MCQLPTGSSLGGQRGVSPWLSVPLRSFPTPRLVPCREPSVTRDIFFHLEENPTSLRLRRVSEVIQTMRGSSGFRVPILCHSPHPWLRWAFPAGLLALLFSPGPVTQQPPWPGPCRRPLQPGTLSFWRDPSPASGHHSIHLLPGPSGCPKGFRAPQVRGGEVPVSGLMASRWGSPGRAGLPNTGLVSALNAPGPWKPPGPRQTGMAAPLCG